MIARRTVLALFGCTLLYVGCNKAPPIVEYPIAEGGLRGDQLYAAPVIVVGRIISDSAVGRSHPSKWDESIQVQRSRVKVDIENNLKGKVPVGQVSICYFIYLNAPDGPPRLGGSQRGGRWHIGDREIFFLRWDSGVLRTVCDEWASCVVPVFSGAHPAYKPNPAKPIEHAIIDILLTRGEGATNQQWCWRYRAQEPNASRRVIPSRS